MGEEARELKVFESGHCFHNNSSIQCSSDGSKQAQFCYMAKFVKEEKEEGEKNRVGRGTRKSSCIRLQHEDLSAWI